MKYTIDTGVEFKTEIRKVLNEKNEYVDTQVEVPYVVKTVIESVVGSPVTYKCKLPKEIGFSVGTFESLETSSKVNGDLQQIKIKRVCDEDGNLEVTITEQTPEQIQTYINSLNEN